MKFDVKMISALLAIASASACKSTRGTDSATSSLPTTETMNKLPDSALVKLLLDLDVSSIDQEGKVTVPTEKVADVQRAASKDGIKVETAGASLTGSGSTTVKLVDPAMVADPTFPEIQIVPKSKPGGTPILSRSPVINNRIEEMLRNDPLIITTPPNPDGTSGRPSGRPPGSTSTTVDPGVDIGGTPLPPLIPNDPGWVSDYAQDYLQGEYNKFDRSHTQGDIAVRFSRDQFEKLKLPLPKGEVKTREP
jgi:hypothetical protein